MRFSSSYVLALCSVLTSAAPVTERDTTGVSTTVLANLNLFAQYSAAAYCYSSINSPAGTKINCAAESGTCPKVESAAATILLGFSTADSTQGYVALDTTNSLIVVSFQGTSSSTNLVDVLTDIDIIQVPTNLCGTANTHDGCAVHAGFYTAATQSVTVVTPVIVAALAAHPTFKIVVTGHSLGGAIAALVGVQLRNKAYVVDIYTYGQPHLGSADINNYIQSQAPAKGGNYRSTHTNDVVPQVPPHDWLPQWDHYYPEYWVNTNTVPVPAASITVVTGSLYVTSGNEGDTSGFGLLVDVIEGISAHATYFGPIEDCVTTAP